MVRRRLLLLLKPFDAFPVAQSKEVSRFTNPRILRYLDNRIEVHRESMNSCLKILQQKPVDWEPLFRNKLSGPIRDVDLVVTVGGDGTLLQTSHFMDDSIPILGVNSDPTQPEEVEEFSNEFDATRSTGYLCSATAENLEQVLDDILEGRTAPYKLSRMAISVNSEVLPTYALNDILMAHPCPATVSRFSFRIKKEDQPFSPLVNCRSSGLRVSTAAGSTAAMLSAGGFPMPISSRELQFLVREPISPESAVSGFMHGIIKPDQSLDATWFSKEGLIYVDGSHVLYSIQTGDIIKISSGAPDLQVYLSPHFDPGKCS